MSGSLYNALDAGQADLSYGLPSGFLESVAGAESSYGTNLGNIGNVYQITTQTSQNPGYGLPTLDGNDPYSAGSYIQALEEQTGSLVGAMQAYGTLPSNLSNLTAGQQQVYNLASAANSNDLSNGYLDSQGNYVPPNDIINPSNPNQTVAGTPVGSISGALGSAEAWLGSAAIRGGVGFMAVLIFIVGGAALVWHSGDVKRAAHALVP